MSYTLNFREQLQHVSGYIVEELDQLMASMQGKDAIDEAATGNWVPVDASGANLSFSVRADGTYLKQHDMATVFFQVLYPVNADASAARIGNLPFRSKNRLSPASDGTQGGGYVTYTNCGAAMSLWVDRNMTAFEIYDAASGVAVPNSTLSGKYIYGVVQYWAEPPV